MSRSPFMYVESAINPDTCDDMVLQLNTLAPNLDETGNPVRTHLYNDDVIERLEFSLEPILERMCSYYGSQFKCIESIELEWVPSGANINAHSENSELISNKWYKTKNRDFTCIVFMSSGTDNVSDDEYDCLGGKLQFVNYGFGIVPQLGDAICFPSDARFANSTSRVHDGDLIQVRVHVTSKVPYIHDITAFPGTYKDWF